MNKTYRTVWNATTGTWAAAPETARMRTKSKSNTAMKSSVSAAVAVMAGVGGGTVSVDAMAQAANGYGSLSLCAPGSTGTVFGSGAISGTRTTGVCGAAISNFRLSEGHVRSFQLYNHSNAAGGGIGQASAATEAGISGTVDGHLFLLGGSGVHLRGAVDFDSNASMTNHRITNLAAGSAGTDAVNLNQLNAAVAAASGNPYVAISTGAYAASTAAVATGGYSATAVGGNARATGISAVALGGNTVASNQNATAIGTLSQATGSESVAVGTSARATGGNSSAFGQGAVAQAAGATAIGSGANSGTANSIAMGRNAVVNAGGVTGANSSIAIGNGAVAGGTDTIVIGTSTSHSGSGATVVGANASAMGGGAGVALGNASSAAGNAAVALGQSSVASGQNSVALGTGSVANAANTVSVGSTTVQRRITNMAAGTAATDAVNVSQLTGVTSALGGGAGVGADGSITRPTYNVAGKNYNNVGDALDALAASGGDPDSVKYDDATHRAITLGNTGTPVGIHNVAAGALSATSKDAVNGSQLFATNTRVGDLEGSLKDGGVIDPITGKSLAVTYDGVAQDKVTLKGADGTTLANLKAGVADMDAVNVSQLKDSGLIGDDGKAIAAVTYDDATKGSVTLGGAGATTPVALKNVADAKDDHDALNLGQLKEAGLVGDDGSGNLTSMAVTYDGAARDKVTLQGADGTTLSNVKAGVADMDAVNVGQMKDALATKTDDTLIKVRSSGDTPPPATAASERAIAIGGGAYADSRVTGGGVGDGAVAIGEGATATGGFATAVGAASYAGHLGSAFGDAASASGASSSAFGESANASGDTATAIGALASATGTSAIALGIVAKADGKDSMALGAGAHAQGTSTVALGADSVADRDNTVSVGSATQQRQIVNVAAGTQDTDAVNVAQLKDSGLIGDDGKAIAAVTYDDATKSSVTLGGAGATTPVAIHNVAAGALSATSTDAVNGSQLFATNTRVGDIEDSLSKGGVIDPISGESLAVVYDGTAKDTVTLKGADGTTLANVKAGVADMDAVNVSQLKGSGLIGDDGKAIAAVTYDRLADGTPNYGSVTFGHGAGLTQLKNVAAATDDTDAVNLGQMKQYVADNPGEGGPGNPLAVAYDDASKGQVTLAGGVDGTTITNVKAGELSATSTDAVNGSQLFATNTRVGDLEGSLKDGGVIDPVTGKSLAVTYDGVAQDKVTLKGADGTTLANVKAGVADMDAVNVSQLKGAGLIGDDGKAIAAVTYDRNADGTPNFNSVTMGGGNATGPVTISNVAAGVAATDAVNVQQMRDAAANGNPYIGGRGTGVAAQATGINAVALGLGSLANEINTISVGNSATGLQRRITNVQNGQADSDAATVGQVNDLIGVASTNTQASINDINAKTKDAIQSMSDRLDSIGTTASANPYVQVDGAGDGSDNAFAGAGTYGVAVGADASATGTTSIAVGAQAVSSGTGSVALGAGASATANGAVAFGSGRATGTSALALGNGTVATGNNAVAAGFNAQAAGLNALAVGNTARANAADSMAFGTTAQVDALATNAIAIGRQASVTSAGQNAVALGAGSVADRLNAISVGSSGHERQIIYVARGTSGTDAVNVSQLRDAMAAFGGSAAVDANGAIVNPTYTIGGTEYHTVGQALDALARLGGGTDPLAVTYGTNADGSPNFEVVSLKGAAGTTLSNVKAGVADMDAVNVSQLKDSGLIGDDGKAIAAVTYDDTTKSSVTLGGAGATTPVALKNVADAKDDHDALNLGQLKEAGLVGDDGSGNLTSMAVTYDGASKDKVTLQGTDGTTLANVKAGVADMDAVNVSQLKDSGLIGDDGKAIAAVTYDDATKASVTLGNAGTPVAIHNVAAGALSETSTDAVNGSQLFATNTRVGDLEGSLKDGGVIDPVTGESLAVVYDGTAKDKVTLKGADGTTLANVKAGVADMDAVNVSQLKGSGLIGDDGKAIAAVTYDRLADGTPNYGSVTFGHGAGPTQLKNVAAATDNTDAVNFGQMKDYVGDQLGNPGIPGNPLAVAYDDASKGQVTLAGGADGTTITNVKAGEVSATSTDAINGAQLHGTAQSVADSLGGGSTVDADGKVTNPTYSLADPADGSTKTDYHNVGDALANLDGRTSTNTENITVINKQLADSGLVDPVTGQSIAAVTYDRNADGTPNLGSVTLGGADATTPVALKNVADGTDRHDAINMGQLQDAGLVAPVDPSNPGAGLKSLAVTYDGVDQDKATLKGADGTTLANVKAGVADMDAVNVSQLKGSGLIGDDGKAIAAVTYDRNADGTPDYSKVTLGHGEGPTQLKNVANATDDGDALNLGQLKEAGLVGEDDKGNLASAAVTYDRNADGTINHDQITLKGADGTTLSNVKAGVADMDAVNVSQLKGSGLIGDDGKAIAAVTYDRNADGTPNYGQATLGHGEGPTQLKNVANATDDGDALNLGQLKEAGLVGDDGSGNLTSLAVTYDNAAKDAITLGGTGATTPVAIHNVADGVLSATSKDAVNGSQLFATNTRVGDIENSLKDGGVIDPVTGKSLAVVYDGAAKDTVTMAGAAGTTIANVKAGVADMDAVNVSQLKGSGLIGDDGKAIAAVTYDRNADGTPNLGSVTLGGAGATTPVALKNVADGVDRHDAINLGQLQDAGLVAPVDPTNPGAGLTSTAVTYDKHADGSVNFDQITLKGGADGTKLSNVAAGEVSATSKDAINGAQLHGTAQSVSDSLGGGSTVDADGKVTNPTYSLADPADGSTKTEYHNVGDALANLDGRTSTNTENITVINKQLGDSGLVDPVTGQTLAAVTYDRNADGTPNRGSVTLGGADATAPVALKNVADGVDANDAVNVGQLQAAGIVAPVDPENPGKGLKSLAVTYDGVDQDKVTLKGADGTTLTNVKAGAVTATSTDAINGSQLHGTAQSVADSLGGGSTVDAEGKVTSPTYSLADPTDGSTKTEYHNVGDALANLDGRTSTNTENITVINKQLADTGLVDPVTGQSLAAVTYDRNADGTPNRGSVTLGGADATAPVALKNVADGTDRHDAINLGQLQDAGLVAPVDPTNPGTGLTSLAVTYDKHADGSANFDQISLKGENGTTITNVKAGAVSATSTDAVNGSQLYGASQSVAKALGGGATVDANGNVTNPTYTVNNEKFDNVGDALDNISSSLVHGSIGLVQQDETTRDITVAKDTDGTTVNFAGTAGDRVLTGVGAGVVSATSNDAINGSQLHGTAQSVADTIGGGTTVDADGKLADTSIEVNGSKYKTVAEAVQAAAAYGATDSLAVRYDLNGDGTPNYGSVTLGGTGAAPVRLTNVANGTTQYDAVNFGQLSELSDRIGGVDDRVGRLEQNPGGGGGGGGGSGGSDYFAGTDVGTGTTPANAGNGVGNTAAGSGAVVGTGVNNGTVVGSNANVSASNGTAIGSGSKSSAEGATAIGNNANASGSKSAAIGDGASASGSNSVALGAGSMATSDNTVSVGSATQQRTISNLADGVNASDAATKGQMDRAIGGVQGQVNELSRNAYSGIAAATALTMIPGVDPGKTLSFGIGGATFQGYQAVAFGGEARITQNLKMKAGVGLSSGGNTVGVGASYQW
ncbi:YadA-like family protein [Burkholderia contaminans]|nr:YadA-like family protein [Burkholderia contaminans]MDK0994695.1 YadA-like family protein [Burkholderia contaminans]